MSYQIPILSLSEGGKPIHKKGAPDGIKSQHKGLETRIKKRKLRKRRSR